MKKLLITGLLALFTAAGAAEGKQVWELTGRPLDVILKDNPLVNDARKRHKSDTVWYFPDCGQVSFINGDKSDEDLKLEPKYAGVFEEWMNDWWTNPDSLAAGSCSSGVCIYNIFPNVDCAEVNIAQANKVVNISKGTVYLGNGQRTLEEKVKAIESPQQPKGPSLIERMRAWGKNLRPPNKPAEQPTLHPITGTVTENSYLPRPTSQEPPPLKIQGSPFLETIAKYSATEMYDFTFNEHLICFTTCGEGAAGTVHAFPLGSNQPLFTAPTSDIHAVFLDNGESIYWGDHRKLHRSDRKDFHNIATTDIGNYIYSLAANRQFVIATTYDSTVNQQVIARVNILTTDLQIVRTIKGSKFYTGSRTFADEKQFITLRYTPGVHAKWMDIYSLPDFQQVFSDSIQGGDYNCGGTTDLDMSEKYILFYTTNCLKVYDKDTHQLVFTKRTDIYRANVGDRYAYYCTGQPAGTLIDLKSRQEFPVFSDRNPAGGFGFAFMDYGKFFQDQLGYYNSVQEELTICRIHPSNNEK